MSALARTGTYRKTARELGVSNTTVARHIEQLERETQSPVFVQNAGIWKPTEAGKKLEMVAKEIESQLAGASESISKKSTQINSLELTTLSFIDEFFLADACHKLLVEHPSCNISIDACDDSLAIEKGEADVALRLARPEVVGLSRFKVAACPIGIFGPVNWDEQGWIGLHEAFDDLPEMHMSRSFFGKEPSIRMTSYPAIAKASLSTGFPGILPTCISSNFIGLNRLPSRGVNCLASRELWFLFHEKRKKDPVVRAASSWVKSIFGPPNNCLCGGFCNLLENF